MPIARLTNVANFDDLLTNIRDFLVATGDWTINANLRTPTEGSAAGGHELIATNGDCLVGLRSTTTGPGTGLLYLFDGVPPYSGTPDIDALPNNSGITMGPSDYTSSAFPPGRTFWERYSGPFPTVTLFTNDPSTYCHVAIQVSAGRFRHVWFGNAKKFGTWTGGGYYATTAWDSSNTFTTDLPNHNNHTVPFDYSGSSIPRMWTLHYEQTGYKWKSTTNITFNGVVRTYGQGSVRGGFGHMFRNIQETPFSGLVALTPVTVWAYTIDDNPDTTRCVAQIRDVAEINMKNLEPGESYFIGSDEWIVFPVATKGVPSDHLDVENSGYYGFAYKVIP